ncbi:hypothetical protein Q1695_004436 [Nippostrongylus brasiliensis]|nr:hypothetical protein Q1695_004436 [Nippostrongylus brasiliensis]
MPSEKRKRERSLCGIVSVKGQQLAGSTSCWSPAVELEQLEQQHQRPQPRDRQRKRDEDDGVVRFSSKKKESEPPTYLAMIDE